MAVDRIGAEHDFGPWRAKFHGETADGRLSGERVVLLKPGTYMNNSGRAVSEAARFYKIEPADIVVFHDELDLAPGKVRFKHGGGHAGHNGLRSIHGHLGPDYDRVRIGIGHPGRKDLVSGYVLHDFAKAETDWLDDVLRGISDGATALADGDHGRFGNAVALRTAPHQSSNNTAGKSTSSPSSAEQEKEEAPAADRRSPLQRLADRFR